jgi:hypothetical protein
MAGEARLTLAKARHFADEAERLGPRDEWCRANLEAAIAFGSSVWDQLGKEFSGREFRHWKLAQKPSSLAKFLTDVRNFALHEGAADVKRVVSQAVTLSAKSERRGENQDGTAENRL